MPNPSAETAMIVQVKYVELNESMVPVYESCSAKKSGRRDTVSEFDGDTQMPRLLKRTWSPEPPEETMTSSIIYRAQRTEDCDAYSPLGEGRNGVLFPERTRPVPESKSQDSLPVCRERGRSKAL